MNPSTATGFRNSLKPGGHEASERGTPSIERRSVSEPVPGFDSPVLARLYAARGVETASELDYRLARLPHFSELAGIDTAAKLLESAINGENRVVIVGDFDADGATSTALACHALRAFGAKRVEYRLPHRVREGYGLSPAIVDAIGPVEQSGDTIVTVDNGISSFAGVDAARSAGWRVIVLDHHLPGEQLPRAEAVVNPNQPGGGAALGVLAGVGVTFYAMLALRARLAERIETARLPRMSDYLDLVAIGTVADCVPMHYVNRALVAQGIRRIRAGNLRPGVSALINAAGRDGESLTPSDIGFGVGPRINAAGRLDDMGIGVACLLADSPHEARDHVARLGALNDQRRSLQREMQAEADALSAQAAPAEDADRPAAHVVYSEDWHEGIVGLIAGRLARSWHRPAIAFAPADNGVAKGSARSIEGLHIRDTLAAVDAAEPDLIERFGGHAGAAGLGLRTERIERFTQVFKQAVQARLTPEIASPAWVTDGSLEPHELDLETARQLRDGGPWGPGFEAPIFDGVFDCLDSRIVGERHLKFRLRSPDGRRVVDAIWFQGDMALRGAAKLRVVYRLEVDNYRAEDRLQLVVLDAWPAG